MNVQIANIHQAEKIYTLIEENEILHAVASRTTEFDNLIRRQSRMLLKWLMNLDLNRWKRSVEDWQWLMLLH